MSCPTSTSVFMSFVLDVESAYKCFIKSLKQDSTFAPAFTSLGIYYNDFLSLPDPIRASKCFQKAFELDAREVVAARHLVEGFANDAEWDLVEVVAQRTIDGEGGVTGGLDKGEFDPTSRYLPTNSWAWKAVGVVKFVSRFWNTFSLADLDNFSTIETTWQQYSLSRSPLELSQTTKIYGFTSARRTARLGDM